VKVTPFQNLASESGAVPVAANLPAVLSSQLKLVFPFFRNFSEGETRMVSEERAADVLLILF
jgi:hypothetical protein